MRFKNVFLFVVLALVVGGAISFFRPLNYKNLPPTATGDWVAFGDSLTAGYGASDGNDYPHLLSQTLGVPIRNLGSVGDTTQDALNRLKDATKLQPRVVLLCLGGNDELQKLSKEQMFSNISQIIDAFQQQGAFVVLIGVHSASLRDTNAGRFKALAREKQALYVSDILDGVLGSPAMMSDYVHPNDAGYKLIAERLAKVLEPFQAKLQK